LLCGVFFPLEQLPAALQAMAHLLPLTHAIELVRPLLNGQTPTAIGVHVGVLLIYGAIGYGAAVALTRRRLLK
jgi:lipooligosaccharide transport system permease protein